MRVNFLGDDLVAIIGAGEETAEFFLRVIAENRKQRLALVDDEDRPVIGDEFGEQGEDEEDDKDPE